MPSANYQMPSTKYQVPSFDFAQDDVMLSEVEAWFLPARHPETELSALTRTRSRMKNYFMNRQAGNLEFETEC